MGDCTYQQVSIYRWPNDREQIAKVKAILAGEGFVEESKHDPSQPDHYTVQEAYLGTFTNEVAPKLIEVAPDIAFDGWEDPKYEYLGAGVRYSKEVGHQDYTCGSDGQPLFTAEDVVKAMSMSDEERAAFLCTGDLVHSVNEGRSDQVILVAFNVNALDSIEAQRFLMPLLPRPAEIQRDKEDHLVEWWIAQDDRIDGSDNHSADFRPYEPSTNGATS